MDPDVVSNDTSTSSCSIVDLALEMDEELVDNDSDLSDFVCIGESDSSIISDAEDIEFELLNSVEPSQDIEDMQMSTTSISSVSSSFRFWPEVDDACGNNVETVCRTEDPQTDHNSASGLLSTDDDSSSHAPANNILEENLNTDDENDTEKPQTVLQPRYCIILLLLFMSFVFCFAAGYYFGTYFSCSRFINKDSQNIKSSGDIHENSVNTESEVENCTYYKNRYTPNQSSIERENPSEKYEMNALSFETEEKLRLYGFLLPKAKETCYEKEFLDGESEKIGDEQKLYQTLHKTLSSWLLLNDEKKSHITGNNVPIHNATQDSRNNDYPNDDSAEWYFNRVENREYYHHPSDWFFERAEERDIKREISWFLKRAQYREHKHTQNSFTEQE